MLCRVTILLFVLLVTPASLAGPPPELEQLKRTPEWQALQRYVGAWEDDVTLKMPLEQRVRSVTAGTWILGERFLQMKTTNDNGLELLQLLTYDPQQRIVRYWWFNSAGGSGALTGHWDEDAQTLTLKSADDETPSVTVTHHFPDADHNQWTYVARDKQGNIVSQASGNAVRQKKTPSTKP